MRRVLLLAATTGYQTRMFGEAAERLGVRLVFATDRCDQLEDPWWDGAIAVRFHQEAQSVDAIVRALEHAPVQGLLAVGDRTTVLAAQAGGALGLPGHPPDAAAAARDKRLTRERLRAAGLRVPSFLAVPAARDPETLVSQLSWPVVVKPTALSGSRGVMRANNRAEFVAAFERVRALLQSIDVRILRDEMSDTILVESFIDGREYALEGLLDHGELRTLAVFDKPDPLDGPFFEETIYVAPSRADDRRQREMCDSVAEAVRALGLHHGPIHAECRVNADGVFVLEVAARPIGGLCARALRFVGPSGESRIDARSGGASAFAEAPADRRSLGGGWLAPPSIGLEELLLRHAVGESVGEWIREPGATGVMMIPIPAGGRYRRVDGLEEAARVPGVWDIRITAKPDQPLVPLPEGASYLGFIFARGDTPHAAEHALRDAHRRLCFVIDRELTVI